MTDFLDPATPTGTLRAAAEWRSRFADLGTFARGISFGHDPEAFAGQGADFATVIVNGISIQAVEWASNDIRFSAQFPDGRSIQGGETFFGETDGRGGMFGLRRVPEADVEARSALNSLLVFAALKTIADTVTTQTWGQIRYAGGIDTPTGKLTGFDPD